jgi:N-acetylglutamate synthase/N-acetylornithine aminotransferase
MALRASKKEEVNTERSKLSEADIRLLLVLCIELVNFCARVTGKIHPSAAAMLAYVRDDIKLENKSQLP